MNNYYEANMPSGVKPNATTSGNVVKKYIKDKYVKKLWIDEEEDDPVYLYQSGQLDDKEDKQKKKEEKRKEKGKRKEERRKRKEEKKKVKEAKNSVKKAGDLINFTEEDAFGDFHEGASESNGNRKDDGMGDLIGGDDDFGEFVTPDNGQKDNDFGDFISSDNTAPGSVSFNTPPQPQDSNLINNLSDLYNQNPKQPEISDNKYAALENLAHQFPQPQANLFTGMNVNAPPAYTDPFKAQNPTNFTQQPQSWANPTPQAAPFSQPDPFSQPQSDPFSQSQFPPQSNTFAQSFPSQPAFTPAAPANYYQNSSTPFSSNPTEKGGDLFGLKATLKSNKQYHKYDNRAMEYTQASKPKEQSSNAFSGLVSSQWNS
mmetsp:Transcript_16857/g.18802  ORF Transcript_16857/g.18802 Transcript_16857/m.18802 type:complete len:372 (+) Transcript_16857:270-1385(+)|eukprot:CAMPEP_0205831102 /NCGR_PEP_ID=MMETSP0206-20130828/43092_1 /ASSEMBLY_ACC=CAM_ASM_000279 /TAXON_ID=36767 /ORGANISM="Euplotes focardii, Strain TN1" /LENGTH=371 /DNA_ID=CAMNT_0053135411 /DNA_START=270 /DNA_END=1385 /DNA_ORIENTATION=+